jgi:hypothetical protein
MGTQHLHAQPLHASRYRLLPAHREDTRGGDLPGPCQGPYHTLPRGRRRRHSRTGQHDGQRSLVDPSTRLKWAADSRLRQPAAAGRLEPAARTGREGGANSDPAAARRSGINDQRR